MKVLNIGDIGRAGQGSEVLFIDEGEAEIVAHDIDIISVKC